MSPKASGYTITVIDLGKSDGTFAPKLGQVLIKQWDNGRVDVDWRHSEHDRWEPISHFGGELLRNDYVVQRAQVTS